MKGTFHIDKFRELQYPFLLLIRRGCVILFPACVQKPLSMAIFEVHYAVKANANPKVLTIIRENGLGADCVSGGEVRAAIKAGFPANKVVFAG